MNEDSRPSMFSTALAKMGPYAEMPQDRREFYGAKLKGNNEHYQKYVRPQYVLDNVDLNPSGMTAGMNHPYRQTQLTDRFAVTSNSAVAEASGAPKAPTTMRLSATRNSASLINTIIEHFGGKVPRLARDVEILAELMPGETDGRVWDGNEWRRRALDIQKIGKSSLTK